MTRLPERVSKLDLTVQIPPAKAWYAGRELRLPTASVRILRRLLCAEAVTTDQLIEEQRGGAEAVRVAIWRVRDEFGRQLVPITIHSTKGVGYSLEWRAPAEHVPAWLRRLRRRLNPHRDRTNPWRVKEVSA